MIGVINVTYKSSPYLEPLAAEQIVGNLKEAGIPSNLFCTSILGRIGDTDISAFMSMKGLIFYGLVNVRGILDENQSGRNHIATLLREKGFKGFIIAGGHQAAIDPVTTLHDCAAIDYILISDPDYLVVELVRRLLNGEPIDHFPGIAWRDGIGIRINSPSPSLKSISSSIHLRPYLEWLIKRHPPEYLAALIETSRGCSHNGCNFCSTPIFTRKIQAAPFRMKPIPDVISEMSDIMNRYGVHQFVFEDDSFCTPDLPGERRLEEFLRALPDLPLQPAFSIIIRPDCIKAHTEPLIKELRDAGMQLVYLGIESFCDEDLIFYNKGVSFAQIIEAIEILYGLGYSMDVSAKLRLKPGLLPFHPYTKLSSINKQIALFSRYGITPVKMLAQVELYPGTRLYELARNDGLLVHGTRSGFRFQNEQTATFHKMAQRGLKVIYKTRKQIRNIEKTAMGFCLEPQAVVPVRQLRERIEHLFYRYYVNILSMSLETICDMDAEDILCDYEKQVNTLLHTQDLPGSIDITWRLILSEIALYYRSLPEQVDPVYFRPCWFPVIH